MRVVVVGLGPGPTEWLTRQADSHLRQPGGPLFARTAFHPALADVACDSFDDVYRTATSLDEVHATIAERLMAAGEGAVLAVPGDGMLGEALLQTLRDRGVDVEVVPGVPLGAGALAAAGVETAEGAQLLDAAAVVSDAVEPSPRWPLVVTGVYSRALASDLKLHLQRVYPPEHRVWVTRHPGLTDQSTRELALSDLDRGRIELDHLTHLVLPPVPTAVPTGSAQGLRAIIAQLRAPEGGCPWDLEQTHRTLIPYIVEETYEVVDAIEADEPAALAEELGDVLLQVALHAQIADQSDEFDWNDVVRGLSAKLVRRHPHVFGEWHVGSTADVVRNWDVLKAAERADEPPRESALDGVPRSMPALKRAAELAARATRAGFDWPERAGTLAKVREELDELLRAESLAERREELGDLLYVLTKLAAQDGIDAEDALRAANAKFTRRFQILEAIARERGWPSLKDQPLSDLESAWQEAKQRSPSS